MFISKGSTSNNGGVPFLLKKMQTYYWILVLFQSSHFVVPVFKKCRLLSGYLLKFIWAKQMKDMFVLHSRLKANQFLNFVQEWTFKIISYIHKGIQL